MWNPLLLPLLLFLAIITGQGDAALRPGFYSNTCPDAESTVTHVLKKAMLTDIRSAASVMRLQFHDCFVNGCDGSLLLDDTPTMLGEKGSLSNINSLRSYQVIDEIKEALERICPATVSCADIIIMAARDAVALSGGPDWEVRLGRLDSLTASQADSDAIMPSPRANASALIQLFARFNLSVKDLVALSGSHSIGKGRCFSIMHRLYNQSDDGKPDPAINPRFRRELYKLCPPYVDQNVTVNLDATPKVFDNQYFKDLVAGRGYLFSDETLHTFETTRRWVLKFSRNEGAFFKAFVTGMIKMGDIQSGRPGEVRSKCSVVNKPSRLVDLPFRPY
ncbi:hypothetical protein RND81_06G001300 [Saponaria officinalis]|uniref:Peroxidase n=1 Tax=Saponaria officinalis TaxID=3572 RepID=A0AAW1K4W0_SAPOF